MAKKSLVILLFCVSVFAGYYCKEKFFGNPSLTINSSPDAAVYLNNTFQGTTPLSIKNLRKGSYFLKLEKEKYEPLCRVININSKENLNLQLVEKKLSRIKINSTPEGASVLINGEYIGKTPLASNELPGGEYYLEIMMENYFSENKNLKLENGKDMPVNFTLKHRQVQDYLSRIKKNKHDITAYNDLGELLFRLGRYDESADIYLKGYIAAADPVKWDSTQAKNRSYLLREARTKYKNPEFHKIHDKKVISEIAGGTKASTVIDIFKKVPYRFYSTEYLAAWDSFVEKNKKTYSLILPMIEIAVNIKDNNRVIKAVNIVLEENKNNLNLNLALLKTLMPLAKLKNHIEINKILTSLMSDTENILKGKKDLRFNFEKARFCVDRNDYRQAFYLFKDAVDNEKNTNQKIEYADTAAKKFRIARKYDAASYFLHIIIDTKQRGNRKVNQAKKTLKALPKKYQRKPDPAKIFPEEKKPAPPAKQPTSDTAEKAEN